MTPDPKHNARPQAKASASVGAKAPQLRLERVFDATPDRLWTYWTDPQKYARWLSPQKADLVIHEFDVRVGGRVRFDMPLDNGQTNKEEGVFHVLDRPHRLVTGSPDRSFLIDVTFTPVDGGKRTRLVALIDGVPADWHAAAKEGWGVGFGKLDRLLAEAAAPSGAHVTPDRYVVMERFYKAPPAKVYGAWTTPDLLERFFWPVGAGKVKEFSLKPGGRLVMGHATEPWTATWSYKEIVPGRRLVFIDHWDDGSGHVATGTMEFIAERGGTLVKVRHGPFPTAGPYKPEDAAGGFTMVGDRLAELVETPGAGEGFALVRYFQAPPAKVWEQWTTKAGLDKWWRLSAQDMGYAFRVDRLDVRVGGAYDLVMSNKEHGELHNHGVYTEVVPGKRLAYRWDFDIFLAPGEKGYPIDVSIDFEETPTMEPGKTGTKMTFRQGPMAKPEFTEGSRQGVIANFAKLSAALEAGA